MSLDNEAQEMSAAAEIFIGIGIDAINRLKGPLNDWLRSVTAAQVDGFVDARERFLQHGWPEELADAAVLGLIQRQIDFGKQVAEAMQRAQSNYQAKK